MSNELHDFIRRPHYNIHLQNYVCNFRTKAMADGNLKLDKLAESINIKTELFLTWSKQFVRDLYSNFCTLIEHLLQYKDI